MSEVQRKEYSLKERVQHFTENASLHGIKVVGDSNASRLRRLIWGIAVASFLSLVIMQGVHLVQLTLNPGIQTSVEVEPGDFPIHLPAITICNNNNHRLSVTGDYGELYKRRIINQTEYFQKTAHQIEEMLLNCSHAGKHDFNCSAKFKRVMTDKGVCYTFNSDPENPLPVTISGMSTAWFFLLNVQDYEYMHTDFSFGGSGFKMLIQRQDEYPAVQSNGFSIAPGEETLIALSRSRVLLDKRMNCYNTKDPKFVNPLLHYKFYTEESCYHECFQVYLYRNCGCRLFFQEGDERLCEDQDEICHVNYTVMFDVDPLGLQNCNCPPECDTTVYEMKLSHSRFPASYAMQYLENTTHMPVDMQRDNLALLIVYFETPRVVITKQTFAYDISKLGGDLGGYMGLMLGASFLTVMEVVDLVVGCVHDIITRVKQTKIQT